MPGVEATGKDVKPARRTAIMDTRMADAGDGNRYLDIHALSAKTGLSVSTLHRLKNQRRIPFFQPGGKGAKVLFPPDAIERAAGCDAIWPVSHGNPTDKGSARLSGPSPAWMQTPNTQDKE
jgi:hypothetical protein